MKENDIRPAHLRKKCLELFEKDVKDILLLSKEFVEVDCPACKTKNESVSFVYDGFKFKKCKSCKTLYISPRPTPLHLKNYYANSRAAKFWQKYMFPQSKDARIENVYKPRVDMIINLKKLYNIEPNLLVDVGAGSGLFGKEIARRNEFKKIILIEPGPIEIEEIENSDSIEVINDTFENADLNIKANVVTNFELIEHLFSPEDFLEKVRNLLDTSSFFIFTTPNIEGFDLMILREKSDNVGGPNHLNYFNIKSIKILLERIGFKNVTVSTPGELDADIVRNKHLEGLIDLSEHPFLHYILIENPDKYIGAFQSFLQKNNLSSNMLIVAQK